MYSMYRCTPSVGHAYIPLTTVLIFSPSFSITHAHTQSDHTNNSYGQIKCFSILENALLLELILFSLSSLLPHAA